MSGGQGLPGQLDVCIGHLPSISWFDKDRAVKRVSRLPGAAPDQLTLPHDEMRFRIARARLDLQLKDLERWVVHPGGDEFLGFLHVLRATQSQETPDEKNRKSSPNSRANIEGAVPA